jgi:hypothetical protein
MKVRQIWKSYKPWHATTSFPKHWEYNYGQYLVGGATCGAHRLSVYPLVRHKMTNYVILIT